MKTRPQVARPLVLTGVIIMILGIWGALVPFVGPTFGYGMGGAAAWTWSESHVTLHLLPGLAAIAGAVLLLRGRLAAKYLGAVLAVTGGIWFVIGPTLQPLWASSSMGGMSMGGSALSSALSGLGYHYGTGALIAVFAGYALGSLGASSSRRAPGVGEHDRSDSRLHSDTPRVSVDA